MPVKKCEPKVGLKVEITPDAEPASNVSFMEQRKVCRNEIE